MADDKSRDSDGLKNLSRAIAPGGRAPTAPSTEGSTGIAVATAIDPGVALPLVEYKVGEQVVFQRIRDGYVNATALCGATGRFFGHYNGLKNTQEFLSVLSSDIGIPISDLVQIIKGGTPELQGTWVHPQVAINLAQWLSPKFSVRVTQWVFDWMSGTVPSVNLPYHLRRYMANMNKVPGGHFSILTEMTISLIAPLEQLGYHLPENLMPDISQGRMFSRWLRKNGHDPDSMPTYEHDFENGRVCDARAYPNEVLHLFRKHFASEWMAKKSVAYFEERDPAAIPYLRKLLALPNYRDVTGLLEED